MRVAIIRRAKGASFSMDVYADGIVGGLCSVRPNWEIVELIPSYPTQGNVWVRGLQKYFNRYWQFPQSIRQCKADIVHVIDHSDGHYVYWLKSMNQPVIVTCHDLINFKQPENINDQASLPAISTAFWKYSVRGIRQANHLITVSAHTAGDVQQLLQVLGSQLTVVPNAVNEQFHPISNEAAANFRKIHKIPTDAFCLLNVGSNHPRKNVFTVVKALAALRKAQQPVHLLKVGADFTQEQQTFLECQGLAQTVTYLGKPDQETLVAAYGAADVLVAPSLYEGFGMTVLEAMACGTPVITSNVTSLPEVAGDAAIMIDPLDVAAIAQAVQTLRENRATYDHYVRLGYARSQSFTWEKAAEGIAAVYEKLWRENARPSPILTSSSPTR